MNVLPSSEGVASDAAHVRARMSPLTLRFADPELERSFQHDYLVGTRGHVRVALLMSVGLYAVFGLLDRRIIPDAATAAWLIRFGLFTPAALVLAAIVPRIERLATLQRLCSSLLVVGGVGIVAMTLLAEAPGSYLYYAGLLMVCIAAYTFLRLRFVYATAVAWLVVSLYELAALAIGDTPGTIVVSNTFFLVGTNVIGMSAAWTMERQTRREFLDKRTIAEQAALLSAALRQAQDLAQRDPLTGVFNRRAFFDAAAAELALSERLRAPLSFAMVDIDHFKQVNDRFGHAVGDRVLQEVVVAMQASVRRSDLIFRYGGEEFVLILPDSDERSATSVGERLRASIERVDIGTGDDSIEVTASVGIATRTSPEEPIDALVDRADAAMYAAKQLGRNRVVVS